MILFSCYRGKIILVIVGWMGGGGGVWSLKMGILLKELLEYFKVR